MEMGMHGVMVDAIRHRCGSLGPESALSRGDSEPLEWAKSREFFSEGVPVRILPLLLLGFAALAARLFAHNGERVGVGAWELPHLCPARAAGESCLGCGATRASLDMLQGDFASAWHLQPFVFLLPLVFVVEALSPTLGPRRTRLARTAVAVAIVLTALLPRALSL